MKYTAVGAKAGRAVAGFLRYVQYRDHHELPEHAQGVEGLTRYVAFRDRASPQGRLFDATGTIGDAERKELAAYVRRSTANVKERHGAPARAVYRLVLSPEDARGLDLRAVARAAMDQLARDAGGLPPWIAAEHRNTRHPHVHVVLAAFRETAPGEFQQLLITKPRLAAMKQAMTRELGHQRGRRTPDQEPARVLGRRRPVHDRPKPPKAMSRLPPLIEFRPRKVLGLMAALLRAGRSAELAALQEQAERERYRRQHQRGYEMEL